MKNLLFTIIAILVAFICGAVAIWSYMNIMPVVTQDHGIVYYLKPGTPKTHIAEELSQQGVINHPQLFAFYVYLHPQGHLKTGEYLFPKGATMASIWRQITLGTGLYYRPFTIIPGWSFSQLRKALAQTDTLNQFTAKLTDQQIMAYFGKPDLAPEGQFYPETYYYTRGNPDLVILKRAFDLMQSHLNNAWQNRAPGLPYKSSYEALTAASLVEKEAYLASERPIIAGVIMNRLRKNMLLQIDPTVIYGMGERYNGKIHKDDLHADTPYNTYVHKGLPPTPIAMPSLDSIRAVMHPQEHDYYYFVAKGDGSHQFSKTLPEHNNAVKAAIKKQPQAYYNDSAFQPYIQNLINIRSVNGLA